MSYRFSLSSTLSTSVIPTSLFLLLKHLSIFMSPSAPLLCLQCLSTCFLLSVLIAVSTSPFAFVIILYLPCLSLLYLFSLCAPLSACLLSSFRISFFDIIFYLSGFFLCLLSIVEPNVFVLVVYCLVSLEPWRWIIEQSDPWMHSCCLAVVCVSIVSVLVVFWASKLTMAWGTMFSGPICLRPSLFHTCDMSRTLWGDVFHKPLRLKDDGWIDPVYGFIFVLSSRKLVPKVLNVLSQAYVWCFSGIILCTCLCVLTLSVSLSQTVFTEIANHFHSHCWSKSSLFLTASHR